MSSNYTTGHNAEKRAAKYLESQGFRILELNWKTGYCEIDIVAQKDRAIYLVEVKYRRSTIFGHGMDYVTPKKLRQMHFAAELWVQDHQWPGDYQLAIVSMDGPQITFIDDL